MRLAILSTATALALGLTGAAFAVEGESTQVPGSELEGQSAEQNPGALEAPEKGDQTTPSGTGGMSDDSANVPGADAEGDPAGENQGALSAPEKDADPMKEGRLQSDEDSSAY